MSPRRLLHPASELLLAPWHDAVVTCQEYAEDGRVTARAAATKAAAKPKAAGGAAGSNGSAGRVPDGTAATGLGIEQSVSGREAPQSACLPTLVSSLSCTAG